MLTYLRRLVDERTSLTEVATRMADTAGTENRDLTDTERSQLAEMQQRCASLDDQIRTYNEQAESSRAYAGMIARMADGADGPAPGAQIQTRQAGELERLEAFLEGDEFRSYGGRGTSPIHELHGYLNLETRAPIMTSQLSIQPYIWPTKDHVERYPLLDLANHVTVSSGTVEWTTIGPTPVAAVVAEGALKPEAALVLTPETAALDTIAHWLSITRQALEDAAYMRSLIEGKLRRGLFAKISQDMIAALVAAALPTATGDELMTAIRAGVGVVEAAGYNPNAVALNPTDYAQLDIENMHETTTGATRTTSFWGLQPVPVPGLAAGEAYVGDFTEGLTLFDRGSTSVFATDSHADFFLRNTLVILAEARVKSVVTDLPAFAKCSAVVVP
jgi:HK97 family phage major capsid protein